MKPSRESDIDAAGLNQELDDLAEWIYNGHLDDRMKLRTALGDVAEKALKMGYDIGYSTVANPDGSIR